jgi:cobalt/nickel transport protein
MPFRVACSLAGVFWVVSLASAHYTMLLPETPSAKKDVPVTLVYQWGHPFEHQLFDAAPPLRLLVFSPDGNKQELTEKMEKVKVVAAEGKAVTAYRLRFTPQQRGDYVFVLSTPPLWMEEDREFFQDNVQVVLHVQAQRSWDADTGQAFKLVPLTRPYGLTPGNVFQARFLASTSAGQSIEIGPMAGKLVELERYNPRPPLRLPADELITRTFKTDPNGIVTCTLPDPGWWCITAQRPGPEQEHEGKRYLLKQRASLWVFVDKNPPATPAK